MSEAIARNAWSTLILDFAEVSKNFIPNSSASDFPWANETF